MKILQLVLCTSVMVSGFFGGFFLRHNHNTIRYLIKLIIPLCFITPQTSLKMSFYGLSKSSSKGVTLPLASRYIYIYVCIYVCICSFVFIYYLAVLSFSCSTKDPVPCPGVEPGPPALAVWSLSRWTTREAFGSRGLLFLLL